VLDPEAQSGTMVEPDAGDVAAMPDSADA